MKFRYLPVLGASLVLFGCGSAPVKQATVKPDWVLQGGGAFGGDKGTAVYGVGVANADPNVAMQREASDNRAMQDIATELKTSVAKEVKDYMDSHKDYFNPDNTAGSDEMVTIVSKSVTDAELTNCQIVNHWEDPDTGALYALARMDINDTFFDAYKDKLKNALREQHRVVMEGRMKEAINNLDADVDKQRAHEDQILGVTPSQGASNAPAQNGSSAQPQANDGAAPQGGNTAAPAAGGAQQ